MDNHRHPMTKLRLGAELLPSAEVGLVRALVQLAAANGNADLHWVFVDAPPYDALITDSSVDPSIVQGRASAILVVGGQHQAPGRDRLQRPITGEQLERWLLAQQAARPIECAAPDIAAAQSNAAEPPWLDGPDSARPMIEPDAGDGIAYRLVRWPPNVMLQNDRGRVRMATLMSRRPLRLSELAHITEQPVEHCLKFVQSLRSLGLLEVIAVSHPSASAVAEAPIDPQRANRWNLVRSIRSRLGLTASE